MLFTLDTNCLIDVDEDRPNAAHVRRIVAAHPLQADVAYVAISASERQKNGGNLELFDEFVARLHRLSIAHLRELPPMMYFDVAFWDHAYLTDEAMGILEQRIHNILFPGFEIDWAAFAAARSLDPNKPSFGTKWHNAKCDVQALWSHIHHGRDVFVTSDRNFLGSKRAELTAIGAKRILRPVDAAALLP